jgi:hypothetical protein
LFGQHYVPIVCVDVVRDPPSPEEPLNDLSLSGQSEASGVEGQVEDASISYHAARKCMLEEVLAASEVAWIVEAHTDHEPLPPGYHA